MERPQGKSLMVCTPALDSGWGGAALCPDPALAPALKERVLTLQGAGEGR